MARPQRGRKGKKTDYSDDDSKIVGSGWFNDDESKKAEFAIALNIDNPQELLAALIKSDGKLTAFPRKTRDNPDTDPDVYLVAFFNAGEDKVVETVVETIPAPIAAVDPASVQALVDAQVAATLAAQAAAAPPIATTATLVPPVVTPAVIPTVAPGTMIPATETEIKF